jgi:polyribonucleotide nucleotidyltransferase
LLIPTANVVQDISGDELVKALQIKEKIPRRKALSAVEAKVITILSEQGYVCKDISSGIAENLDDVVEDEDEDEVIVDGEVDEGDVHIKPVSRKPPPQVMVIVLVFVEDLVFINVSIKHLI